MFTLFTQSIIFNSILPVSLYIIFIIYYSLKDNFKHKASTLSLSETYSIVIFNLFVIVPIAVSIWSLFEQWQILTISVVEVLLIVPTIFCISIFFGLAHYCIHKIPFAFKYHSLHHKAIITKACDALYVHPLEFAFCVIFPTFFSVYIFKLSYFAYLIVLIISIHENVVGHLSYNDIISEHNYHHLYFGYNYDSYPYILGKYILKNHIAELHK